MWNWLSSKPAVHPKTKSSTTESKIASYLSYIPGVSFLNEKFGFISRQTATFSQSAYGHLKAISGLFPRIGLTGSGFSINGFRINLTNIPHQLGQYLRFTAALCLVTAADAAKNSYYFMSEQRNTTYRLDLDVFAPVWANINLDDYANATFTSCNASSAQPPYPSLFSLIYTANKVVELDFIARANIFEQLYRATDNTIVENNFVKCLTESMDIQEGSSNLIVTGLLITVATVATLYCCCKASANTTPSASQGQAAVPPVQVAVAQNLRPSVGYGAVDEEQRKFIPLEVANPLRPG